MKKIKKIFLVRHAEYDGSDLNPSLSRHGHDQSIKLGQKISGNLVLPGAVTIWTSSANRARETASLIKQELQLAEMRVEEKLWSDNRHRHDFPWLENELNSFEGDNLIIVSHLEYVRDFPHWVGFNSNGAGYAEGVMIENGNCTLFG
jgi:phosphohistidine phosphatase SixA